MKENMTDDSSHPKSHYSIEFIDKITFSPLSENFEVFDGYVELANAINGSTSSINNLAKKIEASTNIMKDSVASMNESINVMKDSVVSMNESTNVMKDSVASMKEISISIKNASSFMIKFCNVMILLISIALFGFIYFK